jgi:hypothetical protein
MVIEYLHLIEDVQRSCERTRTSPLIRSILKSMCSPGCSASRDADC